MSSALDTIRTQITETQSDVSYIKGRLDTLIPELATKGYVDTKIAKHEINCTKQKRRHRSDAPPPLTVDVKPIVAKISALVIAVGALSAAVWKLVSIFN